MAPEMTDPITVVAKKILFLEQELARLRSDFHDAEARYEDHIARLKLELHHLRTVGATERYLIP